jgi:hypothetical protein
MEIKRAEKRGTRPFWPVLGFLMLVALGVLAYTFAPDAIRLARQIFPAFRGPSPIPPEQMRLAFAAIVFLVGLTIGAGVIALFAPKSKMQVRDKDLAKERDQMLKARAAAKRRQRKLNNKMRNL